MMIRIFIDFDGTITKEDVGNNLFEKFGGEICKLTVNDFRNGKISAYECFTNEANACNTVLKPELDKFIDEQEIDSTFPDFLEYCETNKTSERDIKYYIVSDGLDYYIKKILNRYGLSYLDFFSNKLELEPADNGVRLKIDFPFTDDECDRCGFCKRNKILTLSADADIIIYIGDGYSDICPVRYADIVFARGELQAFCQKENITYFLYKNFNDVVNKMNEILARKNIRKRQQAEFNRKEIFSTG